jgi:hypothetical protein
MSQIDPGIVMPSEEAEGDHHECCCDHVVDELEAMPAPALLRYGHARDKFYACPHHEITPLEVWMATHKEGTR